MHSSHDDWAGYSPVNAGGKAFLMPG